jgi:hypothetical protein
MDSVRIRTSLVVALIVSMAVGDLAFAGINADLAYGLRLAGIQYSKRYDPLSRGYYLNITPTDPSTGASFYSNTLIDLGFADLTLGYGPNGIGDSFRIQASYTKRVVPTAHFIFNTGGRPLDYRFTSHIGGQNLDIIGSALINVDTRINQYGFYQVTLQASNRAQVGTNGALGTDANLPDLNYDIGPLSLTGNIYVDAIAAITDPFFEQFGTENPFRAFDQGIAGLASATTRVDDLLTRLESGQLLSDQDLATLISNSILSSAMGKEPSAKLFQNLVVPDDLLASNAKVAQPEAAFELVTSPLPEPGMLLLLASVSAGFFAFSRRRGRQRASH